MDNLACRLLGWHLLPISPPSWLYWICVLLDKRCSAYRPCGLEVQLTGAEYVELPVTESDPDVNIGTGFT
jgi:hypothetical protein